jgi:diguanylate cyclase (GGDEF)-like protein
LAITHTAGLAAVLALMALLGRRVAEKTTAERNAQAILLDTHRLLALSEAGNAQVNRWLEMAEQIAQIGHWNLDVREGARVTWSEEVFRIHGVDPHAFDLTLESAIAAYHPRDRAKVAACLEEAVTAGTPFEFTAQLIRGDGSIGHVLSRGLPQTNARGAITGVFGVFMDITEQKRAEADFLAAQARAEVANRALEAANEALEEMAMQDALTGLANRRHFDRALDMEFRRAMRAGSPIALILIDVDCFKQYNDTYGHPAGDACLRAIASTIPPLLNRPGDTANRYGGEEIVVLLPGNTEAGAAAIANRIADAIRALALPHSGSPHGVVTISAGIHACVPAHDRDTPNNLLHHADQALYAAKRAGRDRVLTFSKAVSAES